MNENLIAKLIPHQGCVITRIDDYIHVAGSAMNWIMSAAVAPFACRPPFVFRVVGKTDSTNLRMHFHRGELIFNWERQVHELRANDPATGEQHGLADKGFLTTNEWHEILWEIRLDRWRCDRRRRPEIRSNGRLLGHRVHAVCRSMLRQRDLHPRV